MFKRITRRKVKNRDGIGFPAPKNAEETAMDNPTTR